MSILDKFGFGANSEKLENLKQKGKKMQESLVSTVKEGYERSKPMLEKMSETVTDKVQNVQNMMEIGTQGQGNISPQKNADQLLSEGRDAWTRQDYAQAFVCYQAAAEQNNPEAQNLLGNMWYNGNGCERDYQKALYWYEEAAKQNEKFALYNLGQMFLHGHGVESNLETVRTYWQKAMQSGNTYAKGWLWWLNDITDTPQTFSLNEQEMLNLALQLNQEEYLEDGVEYLKILADGGNQEAVLNLANQAYSGQYSMKADYPMAIKLFSQLAQQGNPYALYNLARIYRFGRGVDKNYQRAMEYYQQAIQQGHQASGAEIESLKLLISMDGKVTAQLTDNAEVFQSRWRETEKIRFYEQQVHMLNIDIFKVRERRWLERTLANYYRTGLGVEPNLDEAIEHYKAAMELQDAESYRQFGVMCQYGNGVSVNYEEALRCYQMAANLGSMQACKNLRALELKMRFPRRAVVGSMSLSDAKPVQAAQVRTAAGANEEGVLAMKVGDYDRAYSCIQEALAIDADFSPAVYNLGWLYLKGQGVGRDLEKARECWIKASNETGNAVARRRLYWINDLLGRPQTFILNDEDQQELVMELKDDGWEEDALRYLQMLVDRGNERAELLAAHFYSGGECFQVDYELAFKLCRRAIEQRNDAYAFLLTAQMYRFGRYVKQDYDTALHYFRQAAEHGMQDCGRYISMMEEVLQDGGKLPELTNMSEEELCNLANQYDAEGYLEKLIPILRELVGRNNNIARIRLARYSLMGQGVKRDVQEAGRLLRDAINTVGSPDDSERYVLYGIMCEYGIGVPQNCSDALICYRRGVRDGNREAEKYLAALQINLALGRKKVPDKNQCPLHYEEVRDIYGTGEQVNSYFDVENGYWVNTEPLKHIPLWMREDPLSVTEDPISLIELTHADKIWEAEEGDAKTQAVLGFCYLNDMYDAGVDFNKAFRWLDSAAEQDDCIANYFLGFSYATGAGHPVNLVEARKYYERAIELGGKDARWSEYKWDGLSEEEDDPKIMGEDEFGELKLLEEFDGNLEKYQAMTAEELLEEAGERFDDQYFMLFTRYMQLAAEKGRREAQYYRGYAYETGYPWSERSYEKAYEWYERAAEQGLPEGMFGMGNLFRDGKGVERDVEKAKKYYSAAFEGGCEDAEEALKQLEQDEMD